MKNWWLDLYTIPGLKLLGRSFLFVLIPTLLLVFLLPDMLFIMFYGSFYIAYCSKKASAKSFSANIEFHKLHVPFEELRKALIKDSLIQGVFYFLAYFTIWMLTDLFDPADLGDFKYTILLIFSLQVLEHIIRLQESSNQVFLCMSGLMGKSIMYFL